MRTPPTPEQDALGIRIGQLTSEARAKGMSWQQITATLGECISEALQRESVEKYQADVRAQVAP